MATATCYASNYDTYVDNVNTTNVYGDQTTMYAGSITGKVAQTYRSFIRFDVSGIPSNAYISAATMYLYGYQVNGSSSGYAYAYRVTSSWSENGIYWNNQPGADVYLGQVAGVSTSTQWMYLGGLASAVQNWVTGAWANYGLRLHGGESGEGYLYMYTTENGQTPYIQVTYTTPPGAPTVTYPNGGETLSGTHSVTWSAASDSDGQSLTYYVQYSSNNGSNWSDIGSTTSTSLSVNFANLAATTQGKVRVRAYDGAQYGSWDESNATFTNNASPTAPTLVSPSNGAALPNTSPVTFDWTPNDTNAGDTQSAYALRRKRLP